MDISLETVLQRIIQGDDGFFRASFRDFSLQSAFQPIYSVDHQQIVGHEALIRTPDATPKEIFASPQSFPEKIFLDRICRCLHMHNYVHALPEKGWLFLNINHRSLGTNHRFGTFLGPLLASLALPPARVVVEILEDQVVDEDVLIRAVEYYKGLGCLVALDDFGAGHSNFDRIWRLLPHLIKLDRSLIESAVQDRKARRLLYSLVPLIHEAGSLVLMEGVETREQVLLAIDAGADLLQGFYLGRPGQLVPQDSYQAYLSRSIFTPIYRDFQHWTEQQASRKQAALAPYLKVFRQSLTQLEETGDLARSVADLLQMPHLLGCYLLDPQGVEVGTTLFPDRVSVHQDPRFIPLASTAETNWYRAPYFRTAIQYPGRLHVSNPYLSLVHTSRIIITLSMTTQYHPAEVPAGETRRPFYEGETPGSHNTLFVFCCDLDVSSEDWPSGSGLE